MNSPKSVQRIAIVGTGTIGASWATHFLARGFDVTATDPAPPRTASSSPLICLRLSRMPTSFRRMGRSARN